MLPLREPMLRLRSRKEPANPYVKRPKCGKPYFAPYFER
jgi:hypothetical protein